MSKTRSPIIEAVRDTAKGLRKAGVTDQVTLREIDPLWLPPVEPLEPAEIRRIRERAHVRSPTAHREAETAKAHRG